MSVKSRRSHRYLLLAIVGLLLFGTLLRLQNLVTFVEWPDEIRTVWRTQFGLDNMLIRNPMDWPPLYPVLIWVWVRIAGPTLEVSRYLSVLFSMVGTALIFLLPFRLTPSLTSSTLS